MLQHEKYNECFVKYYYVYVYILNLLSIILMICHNETQKDYNNITNSKVLLFFHDYCNDILVQINNKI